MNIPFSKFTFLVPAALLFLAAQRPSLAGSATWAKNPTSGDWNTAANWRPQTVPNATTDIATFGASNVTDVTNTDVIVNLDSLVFSSGAPSYSISALDNIDLDGAGILNNSGTLQSFIAGVFFFNNVATAGDMVSFTTVGGAFVFTDASSAGSGTFNLMTDRNGQASMSFEDNSTAEDATINASSGSVIEFFDNSNGGHATLNLTSAAFVLFESSNNAEQMIGNCVGGDDEFGSEIGFEGFSSAGTGTFTTIGGSTSGEQGGLILFDNTATADHAAFIINGGMGAGLSGTTLLFIDNTTAANAKITANGGVDGSKGGWVSFQETSTGGTCSITLKGNATLDLTKHSAGLTIGSLAGDGAVPLGANPLTIGSNNASTVFSGVISGSGGVSKTGTGTLTLSGMNTYTGSTMVNGGVLMANNKRGSATGTGGAQVQTGALGGKGYITGPVTIGSGTGSEAFLAPSVALKQPATLTLKSTLTFKADSSYSYTLKAKRNKAQSDQVMAKGVTIESGAQFNFTGQVQGKLRQGTTFSVISNTASTPIAGTFANLPEGAVLSVSGNNLQASYSGGDGNDLTLSVVP